MADWKRPGCRMILASGSPRRKEILQRLGLKFRVVKPLLDENDFQVRPDHITADMRHLALAKAHSVADSHRDALVLGSDTIVVHERAILGKPRSATHAREMIRMLSGKSHLVYSSVALVCWNCRFKASAVEKTVVTFRRLDPWEISQYLQNDEYRDKAGAYGIQGLAMAFVEKISGCYYNVMGLPVKKTIDLLSTFEIERNL